MSKILRTVQNKHFINKETALSYAEDLSRAKRLNPQERDALIEIRHLNLKANAYFLPNPRRTTLVHKSNGKVIRDWFNGSFGAKTVLSEIRFISVDVDGKDLKKRFPDLSTNEIENFLMSKVNQLQYPPDIIVKSGSECSFHFHWSIRPKRVSPNITKDDRKLLEMAKSVQGFLREHLKGDPAAKGINRIWRVPGSLNFKKTNKGPTECEYYPGSRSFEEAYLRPSYNLEDLISAYATVTENTDSNLDDNSGSTPPTHDFDFEAGWEDKMNQIIPESKLQGLTATEVGNLKVVFKQMFKFRHYPDRISFPKKGVLEAIRGKHRPYTPFHRTIAILNEIAAEPILEKLRDSKWSSNPKLSRATEYGLTGYGRQVLGSNPSRTVDIFEQLYVSGQRHNGLYRDGIRLFKAGYAKSEVTAVLKEKNLASSVGVNSCQYDEEDLFRQINRAEEFVLRLKKSEQENN
jgi:hypothetical protein